MLTKQQMFDKVVERLMDNTGQASESEHGSCSYLTKDGNKCAVGIFLLDNEEMQNFEGGFFDLIERFKNHRDFPREVTKYKFLIHKLQYIHDDIKNWDGNEFIGFDKLESIAKRHELEIRNVD